MADDGNGRADLKKKVESLESRVKELERVSENLVKFVAALEDDTGEAYMPEGTYHGKKFE